MQDVRPRSLLASSSASLGIAIEVSLPTLSADLSTRGAGQGEEGKHAIHHPLMVA